MNYQGRGRRGGRGLPRRQNTRSFGRGSGRGRGRGNGSPFSTSTPEKVYKFAPHTGGKIHYAPYASVKEKVIEHAQEKMTNGHDVVKSIKLGRMIDMSAEEPVREKSQITDVVLKADEQKGLDIKYDAELNRHLDRRDILKANICRLYTVIKVHFCSKAMVARLEEHPDFESKIEDDPFETLNAIKQIMQDPQRAQYYLIPPINAYKQVLNLKQGPNEGLADYIKRTKQIWDVNESFNGKGWLDHAIEQSEGYRALTDADEQKEFKKKAYDAAKGFMVVDCADPLKYGQLQKTMNSQFTMGQNQYPESLEKGTDILSNHKIDAKYFEVQKKQREQAKAAKEAKETEQTTTSFAQTGRQEPTCYCCGMKGHRCTECKKQSTIPKSEWWINKAVQNYQENESAAGTNNQTTQNNESDQQHRSVQRTNSARTEQAIQENQNSSQVTAWNGYQERRQGFQGFQGFQRHYQVRNRNDLTPKSTFLQKNQEQLNELDNFNSELVSKQSCEKRGKYDHLKDVFMLDTGSTIGATITNAGLVTNIRVSTNPITMATNAGTKVLDTDADIPGFGPAKFDDTSIANIMGFYEMSKQNRITYDNKYPGNEADNVFKVHTKMASWSSE